MEGKSPESVQNMRVYRIFTLLKEEECRRQCYCIKAHHLEFYFLLRVFLIERLSLPFIHLVACEIREPWREREREMFVKM